MQTIRIDLAERSYDIEIGAGNLADVGRFVAERAETSHVVLITDENVHKLHALRVAETLGERDIKVDVIVVPPGEESKSPEVALSLWQGLLDLGTDRRSVVAAVGGGVVGDLAGFIAATFARGLRLLQVPTTLLAQVDSSVGGKVGIDLPEAKNIVGAFHQPLGVLIDVAVLGTLPEREFRSGLAEAVKYGAALDAEFFAYLEANAAAIAGRNEDVLIQVISRCCRFKAEIVERDERDERGIRAALNFGHTFGHAYEMLSPLPLEEGPVVRADEDSVFSGHWADDSTRYGAQNTESEVRSTEYEVKSMDSEPGNRDSPLPDRQAAPYSVLRTPYVTAGPLLHGEAVSIGMVLAARLAERLGRVDASFTHRLRALLQTFGLPVEPPRLDSQLLLKMMMHDKKARNERPVFILPSCLGHMDLIDNVALEVIQAELNQL